MKLLAITLASFLLAGAYPAFGQYEPPTAQEQSMYESMRERFEMLTVAKRDIGDTMRSFDEPVTVSFACNTGDYNRHVQATVKTSLAKFDTNLTHSGGAMTGGIYVWKCSITSSSSGHLIITCQNELMLNHDTITSTKEKDPRIRHMEEMIVFYHELLHGQLMMDAMKSPEWQGNTCNKRPQEPVDFSHTDADHNIIMPLQTELAERLVNQNGGTMKIEQIEPHRTSSGSFSEKVGSLHDYPDYTRGGVNISARSYNISEMQITTQSTDILVSGMLANHTQPGTIWLYVFGTEQAAQPAAQPAPTSQPTPAPQQEAAPAEIPPWIRNNAMWWAEDMMDDRDFMLGIKYLIQNKMITLQTAQSSVPDFIPSWIKSSAKWWADGLVRDSEFVSSLQYLLKSGIIRVNTPEDPKAAQPDAPIQRQTFIQVNKDTVEKSRYQSSQVQITGVVENYRAGTSVILEVTRPDGSVFELSGLITNRGLFTVPLMVDGNYQSGRYDIRAVYNSYEVGTASFTVI